MEQTRPKQKTWVAVSERPIPEDSTQVLVWLESKMTFGKLATACYRPNVKLIGNVFAFDAPKPLYWMDAPAPPKGEKLD